MKPKKIVIFSIPAGAGHAKAADAIKHFADAHYPNIIVEHIDISSYLSYPVRKTFIDSYGLMVKKVPDLWGILYKQTDRPLMGSFMRKIMPLVKQINSDKLFEFIRKFEPDHILHTHFFPAYLCGSAPKKYKKDIPPSSLLFTDYELHNILLVPQLNHFFVPTKKMKWKIIHHGVSEDAVTMSGIPVEPAFYAPKSITKLRKKHGLKEKKPVMLILAGGYGLAKSDAIISTLLNIRQPVQLIAIAGKNKRLEKRLRALTTPKHIDLHVTGWTDIMHEYMQMSDVVISKPGGITLTECKTLKKPIIAVKPIPGQEDRNAHYILEASLGYLAHDPADLLYFAEDLLKNPRKLKQEKNEPAARLILDSLMKRPELL